MNNTAAVQSNQRGGRIPLLEGSSVCWHLSTSSLFYCSYSSLYFIFAVLMAHTLRSIGVMPSNDGAAPPRKPGRGSVLCTIRTILRVYLVLLGVLLLTVGISVELIAAASLELVGNRNPLTQYIPDWPNSWMFLLVGCFLVGGAALYCSVGLNPSLCGRNLLIFSASVLFTGTLVLLILILSGMELLHPEVWVAMREHAASIATGGSSNNATSELPSIVKEVLSPSFVQPFIVVLTILVLLSLFAETFLLCGWQPHKGSALLNDEVQMASKSNQARHGRSGSLPEYAGSGMLVQNIETQQMAADV